jgi:ABC-type glycerol-3-phosphate transport system substrate-binding protein
MIKFTGQEKAQVGIMPWFDMGQGKPRVFTMGMGSAYFASAATKHPKEAAQFLDYLFSDEVVKIWVEQVGVIPPVKIDTSKLTLHPLQKFNIDELTKGGMGYNVDVLAPQAFNLMLYKGMPEVWDGKKAVEQQMADLQKIWKEGYKY